MLRKALVIAAAAFLLAGPALAAGGAQHPKEIDFSFEGPFGRFDQAQLQRGYKVYREVCAACHAMELVSFRHLGDEGGPFYDPEYPNPNDNPYVKALAADSQVGDIDSETGDPIQRPAIPADRFPSPFPNEAAARASNGGALPPDLSVIVKARPNGADYIHGLLVGYQDPPAGFELTPGMSYNLYFPGHQIAMPPPLNEGQVEYADGTEATVERMARDVTAFLAWAAEPKLEARHRLGFQVMIYLIVLAVLLYFSKRRIWARLGHA